MFISLIHILALFAIISVVYGYSPPLPTIELCSPSGFSISIPDEPGLESFAIVGQLHLGRNLTRSINGRANRAHHDHWTVYVDAVRFQRGDVIDYDAFFAHNGIYFQKHGLHFVVEDATPHAARTGVEDFSQLERTILHLDDLTSRVDIIQREIKVLKNVLSSVLKESAPGNKLLLVGVEPGADPLATVREFVKTQLLLSHLSGKVIAARVVDDGILFETNSQVDKKMILLRAHRRLMELHGDAIVSGNVQVKDYAEKS